MDNTKEKILERMKSSLVNLESKLEGSFTMDNLQAVANEIARLYSTEYESIIDRSHLDTATGEDLDVLGINNHGVKRLPATYEEVVLTITGLPNTIITSEVGAKSEDFMYYVTGTYTINHTGKILVTARCKELGAGKKALAGAINKFIKPYIGLISVINETPSSGGYDAETDEAYRKRIKEYEKASAGYGNIAWYKVKAKEVVGVGKAKVIDLARGNGTVDVIIVGNDNTEASTQLVNQVTELIESSRLAGVNVRVEAAKPLPIMVMGRVYLKEGVTLENVIAELKIKLKEYFIGLEFEGRNKIKVSYSQILSILLNCEGVEDADNVLINKMNTSIDIEERFFPDVANPLITKAGK
jgi:baseplate J-like protein